MGSICVLILAVLLLLSNLKGYKTWFKSNDSVKQELLEQLKQSKTDSGKGILIFIITVISTLIFVFYVIAAQTFMNSKILLFYSVLMIVFLILSYFKGIHFVLTEKVPNRGIISRINYPLTTAYICYFIFVYLERIVTK